MAEDEEKFKHADANNDGGLDLDEYIAFYHPGVSSCHSDDDDDNAHYIAFCSFLDQARHNDDDHGTDNNSYDYIRLSDHKVTCKHFQIFQYFPFTLLLTY